jgi:hypothetical protein
MSDRELLELAAKAAGYEWRWFGDNFCTLRNEDLAIYKPWNPLRDDGDAMRLFVKLEMELKVTGDRCLARIPHVTEWREFYHHGDALAATCRATVMVAADMGRAK